MVILHLVHDLYPLPIRRGEGMGQGAGPTGKIGMALRARAKTPTRMQRDKDRDNMYDGSGRPRHVLPEPSSSCRMG